MFYRSSPDRLARVETNVKSYGVKDEPKSILVRLVRVVLRCSAVILLITIGVAALPQAVSADASKSQTQLQEDVRLLHMKQYDSLRDEILRILDEMHRSEFWTAAALGIVYGWLLVHRDKRYSLLIWLGPTIIFVSGFRYFLLFNRVRTIAEYLKRIEQSIFGEQGTLLPGWERYSAQEGGGVWILVTTAVAWLFVFALALSASWYLRQVMEHKKA